MGAVFSLQLKQYDDFETYRVEFPQDALYPFMLDGSVLLERVGVRRPFLLIFGNEALACRRILLCLGRRCAYRIPPILIRSICHRGGHWHVCLYACLNAQEE